MRHYPSVLESAYASLFPRQSPLLPSPLPLPPPASLFLLQSNEETEDRNTCPLPPLSPSRSLSYMHPPAAPCSHQPPLLLSHPPPLSLSPLPPLPLHILSISSFLAPEFSLPGLVLSHAGLITERLVTEEDRVLPLSFLSRSVRCPAGRCPPTRPRTHAIPRPARPAPSPDWGKTRPGE